MGKSGFFSRLALVNLMRNGQFYLPYLLTVMGTAAAYYITVALAKTSDLPSMTRYEYLAGFMGVGTFVVALFAVIFLTYTNSFLMKRRKRELGLYNILGLDKRHIAKVLGMESLYTALAGIGGGILLGLLLQKLVTLLLYKILRMDAYFGFYLSWTGMRDTAALFGGILLGNLLLNLGRIHLQNPMEMLRESSAGEREPKTKLPLAIVGIGCLGAGYTIAVTTQSALKALGVYFVAVFLVILGTYCLFTAGSIVLLKALRRNKRYYYRTNHFIGISGMLYRMKRNAVGLANLCILSTMVLVMISATLSLYVGSSHTIDSQFPGNVSVSAEYRPDASEAFQPARLSEEVKDALEKEGFAPSDVYAYQWLRLMVQEQGDRYSSQKGTALTSVTRQLCVLSAADYALLAPDADIPPAQEMSIAFSDGNIVTVSGRVLTDRLPAVGGTFTQYAGKPVWIVVENEEVLRTLYAAQSAALGEAAAPMCWNGFWNVGGTEEQQAALPKQLSDALADLTGAGSTMLTAESRASFSREYHALNGGFFFLGVFLGTLFLMAAVLIIYYKQVSEGYEDRERYRIMQKVGMEQRAVRKSINSQILIVFFAPLAVAAVHIAFDYGLLTQMLTLFSLYDSRLSLRCTLGTFGVFAAVYALVYWVTARAYYRIVRVS